VPRRPSFASSQQQSLNGSKPPITVESALLFADGTCIELVRDPVTSKVRLLLSRDKGSTILDRIKIHDCTYFPAADNSILSHVRLPPGCAEFKSTGALFASICEVFRKRGFSDDVAIPATYFAISTWFIDCTPIAPSLFVVGPRPEGEFFLQLLACVTYRSLSLSHVTLRGLSRVPAGCTLSLGEHAANSIWHVVGAATRSITKSFDHNKLINSCWARVKYVGRDVADQDVDIAGALFVNLSPSRGPLPILTPREEMQIADALQPQLLAYRCRIFPAVMSSTFDIKELGSRGRVTARVMGAAVVDAPDLQAGLRSVLIRHEAENLAASWADPKCIAIEAALFCCHEIERKKVYIGEINRIVNTILRGRGESREIQPRRMGAILRQLGFSSRRENNGFAIDLSDATRRKVHKLARQFDLASTEIPLCDFCSEIVLEEARLEGSR
jgi:hypothetical protein